MVSLVLSCVLLSASPTQTVTVPAVSGYPGAPSGPMTLTYYNGSWSATSPIPGATPPLGASVPPVYTVRLHQIYGELGTWHVTLGIGSRNVDSGIIAAWPAPGPSLRAPIASSRKPEPAPATAKPRPMPDDTRRRARRSS